MSKSNHRKLWEEKVGPIPRDQDDRSYDIHHINGDHDDNRIENLQCVSIHEHYRIHESQGDVMACCAIMKRIGLPVKFTDSQRSILSAEAKIAAERRVIAGTHNFLGGKIQKMHQARRKKDGTHNFVNNNPCRKVSDAGIMESFVPVINKNGIKKLISSTAYRSQSGEKGEWEFVTYASKEGRKRRSYLQDNNNQA